MTHRRRRPSRIIKRFPPNVYIELSVHSLQKGMHAMRACIECGATSKMTATGVFVCVRCEILFN